ncbi:unnamed protein product [Urochloa humidicola]
MHEFRFRFATWRLLVAITVVVVVSAVAGDEMKGHQGPIGLLSNCTTRCGDVNVPYPVGIGSGCYLAGFNLTCSTNHTPPRLFLGGGTLEVVDISLENATMRVRAPQGHTDLRGIIYNGNGTTKGTWGGSAWGLTDDGPYILPDEHNEFVLIGSHLLVELLVAGTDDRFINSCAVTCTGGIIGGSVVIGGDVCLQPEASGNPRCRKCTGIDCCQAPILVGRTAYDWRLTTIHMPDAVNYGPYRLYISEEGWFQLYDDSVDKKDYSLMSAVLKWTITYGAVPFNGSRHGNATCPEDLGSTTCHSRHSMCTNQHGSLIR